MPDKYDSTASDLPAIHEALRILLLDDSVADSELVLLLLRKSGYQPKSRRVESEAAFRKALADEDWDVVIAKSQLPLLPVKLATRIVSEMKRHLPLVMLSSSLDDDAAVTAMHTGADEYVSKERLTRLVPAIERSLRAASARHLQAQTERSLRDSESRMRALAANTPGMLFELYFDEDGLHFSYISDGSQPLVGIAPDALLESPERFLEILDHEDRDALVSCLKRSGNPGGIVRWEGRALLDRIADESRWLQLIASPRNDAMTRLIWTGVMTDITALKHAEVELSRSRDELRGLTAHLAQTRESERARIAREIHDDIGGLLSGLRADISWLDRRIGNDKAIAEKLKYMNELVDSAAAASVRIARDLRPAVLDFGFVSAMEWLARDFQKHSGITCEFSCDIEDADFDRECATSVFRIFQELLTNITKHSHAHYVSARLEIDEDNITLEVSDDGVGIILHDRRKHESFGVRGMRERAHELGGSFQIGPAPRGGTLAVLRAPRPVR